MSGESPKPLARLKFSAADLFAKHPPVLYDRNKQIVYKIACPPGVAVNGEVVFTRWSAMDLPVHIETQHAVAAEARESIYDYPRIDDVRSVDWHVNFADPDLFYAYGSGLFAQDEMQVAEHPVLGSLLEALHEMGEPTQTVIDHVCTPVLIRRAERRVQIATDADAEEGRPGGLYGNRFSDASEAAIRRATRPIVPPTITNLIAIAAPHPSSGRYTVDQIESILTTAYTGFRAAVVESKHMTGANREVVIHTGFWGCGAFGGNRILMPLLQRVAAEMAGVDRLIFYAVDHAGSADYGESQRLFDPLILAASASKTVREIIQSLVGLGLEWGYSDGN